MLASSLQLPVIEFIDIIFQVMGALFWPLLDALPSSGFCAVADTFAKEGVVDAPASHTTTNCLMVIIRCARKTLPAPPLPTGPSHLAEALPSSAQVL